MDDAAPVVSVAIASYNAARFLEAAVRSAMVQSLAAIEIIIVDDCSTDASVAIAARLAGEDARIRTARLPANGGPAAARNRALAMARGRWFAVLDSDDLMEPGRLAALVAVAEAEGADIIADNLLLFDDDAAVCAALFLPASRATGCWISPLDYLGETVMYRTGANLGYLKPVFRTEALRAAGIRYDARLRIAEDDDLMVRALLAGLRYRLEPTSGYGYRRHHGSTSHRLSKANAAAMLAVSEDLLKAHSASQPPAVCRALATRHAAIRTGWAFACLIDALKARRLRHAAAVALADPAAIGLLRMPIGAALGRLRPGWLAPRPVPPTPAAADALARLLPEADTRR